MKQQRSTVDSRCRLTNFKMSVSQSVSVSSQMLNPVLKTSSGTCQQFVEDAVKISNIFLDFRYSQGSGATYCRCGGNKQRHRLICLWRCCRGPVLRQTGHSESFHQWTVSTATQALVLRATSSSLYRLQSASGCSLFWREGCSSPRTCKQPHVVVKSSYSSSLL